MSCVDNGFGANFGYFEWKVRKWKCFQCVQIILDFWVQKRF